MRKGWVRRQRKSGEERRSFTMVSGKLSEKIDGEGFGRYRGSGEFSSKRDRGV